MLNISMKIPNFSIINSYAGPLDELGIINNCFMGFSFKRLTRNFSDELIYIERSSDSSKRWFGYDSDGNIESEEILNWVGGIGNYGYVEDYNNQLKITNPAYQTTLAKKPKIVDNGVFCSDGLKFDGVDDYLIVDKYNEINFINPTICIYFNKNNSIANSFIFAINSDSINLQYGIRVNALDVFFYLKGGGRVSKTPALDGQGMATWFGKNANEISFKDMASEILATYTTTSLTERPFVRLGAKTSSLDGLSHDYFYNGNLKTILVFDNNQIANFNSLVSAGL